MAEETEENGDFLGSWQYGVVTLEGGTKDIFAKLATSLLNMDCRVHVCLFAAELRRGSDFQIMQAKGLVAMYVPVDFHVFA
jgi:hypothetical protein